MACLQLIAFIFCSWVLYVRAAFLTDLVFSDDFIFGAGGSAYQIEGAWNVNGKGVSVWDFYTHTYPERIFEGDNGDVACDSYDLYPKDIAALKELGVNAYRFSLSWTRLLPTGHIEPKNSDGVRYYNTLIDELLANGIEPIVTIFHWDSPQDLQDEFTGFDSRDIIPAFVNYAEYAFQLFGDRVKTWITFNEISIICVAGYGRTTFAPGLNRSGTADYVCAHHMLLAHAQTYRLYQERYATEQNGKIGITQAVFGYYPYSDSPRDLEAAELGQEFLVDWTLHPIASPSGDYPPRMKRLVRELSLAEGRTESRLPDFTPEELVLVRGTTDFVGINHYTTLVFTFEPITDRNIAIPIDISGVMLSDNPCFTYVLTEWPFGDLRGYSIVPEGFYNTLLRVKDNYCNPDILITENGFPYTAANAVLNDFARVDYLNQYLNAELEAIRDGVKITGHIQWSLIDNFEWDSGYNIKFGLYEVDFSSPTLERIGRLSSRVYRNIVTSKRLTDDLPLIDGDATIF